MTVCITTVVIPKGSGGKAKRKLDVIEYFGGLNKDYRIPVINNGNNYCMFIALELARLCHDDAIGRQLRRESKKADRKLLSNYGFKGLKDSAQKQKEIGLDLMNSAEIPTDLEEYDIKWLENVQNYYDATFPGLYRIVAFQDTQRPEPIW
jgi:hypothetical protein